MSDDDKVGFECVRPIESHARLIMEWRNDPQTLQMSYHKQPKVWESFYPEFLSHYFSMPDLPPLFVLYEGRRVAFIRFRPYNAPILTNRRCCEISINVAPKYRGMGIGIRSLIDIKSWVAIQGYDDIYAEIKQENQPSVTTFLKAGYEQIAAKQKDDPEDPRHAHTVYVYLSRLTPEKSVTSNHVFIIAEAGSNWRMGNRKRDEAMCKILIEIAAEAGADAVKFQTFRPETVYVKNAGQSDYLAKGGIKEEISDIFIDNALPYEMIPMLADYCNQLKIEFMSSFFSVSDFEAINPYVARHKIASYEVNHLRLLEVAAKSGKPLILSTGASTEEEIAWAIEQFKNNGGRDLSLMQCTARYPADDSDMHLKTIPWLKRRFQVPVGLSDHSPHAYCAPVAAVALGATVIEKHFTLDKRLPGPDHFFALDPAELKEMVQAIRKTEPMLGNELKSVTENEQELRAFCHRGIQTTQVIHKGDTLQEGVNIDILRPGKQAAGVHPKYIVELQGKEAKRDIPLGSGIQHGDW